MLRTLSIACCLAVSLVCGAQNIQYTNGPSSFSFPDVLQKAGVKKVTALFRDSRHLVWIGTENGLYRYDGTTIAYQRHQPSDTTTIPDNHIVTITEDQEGQIWLGAFHGVACMNPYNMRCTTYSTARKNLTHDFDLKVLIDGQNQVWSAGSKGLEKLDRSTNVFHNIWQGDNNAHKGFGYLTCLVDYGKDSLIAGSFNGLLIINKQNGGWRRLLLGAEGTTITCLSFDKKERLWAGTWGSDLFLLSDGLQKVKQERWNDQLDKGSHIVYDIIGNGTAMYAAVANGVLEMPDSGDYPDMGKALFHSAGYWSTQNLSRLLLLSPQKIFAGGIEGLYSFSLERNHFTPLPIDLKGVVQEPQSIIWKGRNYLAFTAWHGGSRPVLYDTVTHQTTIIPLPTDAHGLASNSTSITADKFDRLWISTFDGVQIFDQKLRLVYDFKKAKGADTLTTVKTIGLSIFNDTVWVNDYKKGIDLFDLNFKKLAHLSVETGQEEEPIWNIFRDSRGRTWLCGNSNFFGWMSKEKRFRKYNFSPDSTDGGCNDVIEMPDHHLIVAANAGLVDFNPEKDSWSFIQSPLLQRDEGVLSITKDAQNHIWYLTGDHLVQYDPGTKRFELYGEKDGLDKGPERLWVKSFDGRNFYMGQGARILSFQPNEWQKTSEPPRLFVYNLQAGDSTIADATPQHALDLSYNNAKVVVGFDGIEYDKPEQNQYAYKLTPTDTRWTVSDRNFASYGSLAPGAYTLHLKVANSEGSWSDEYLLDIVVHPPWWKRWWAISIGIIVLLTVFFFMIRYVVQRNLKERILILEKEQAVEKERNRIAQDMHDDLGSGLTKIAILSEVAKTKLVYDSDASMPLQKISASSRELVDNLQNIIWALNPRNDSLDNFAAYVREYAVRFFENTSVAVSFQFPEDMPSIRFSEEERRNLFLVVKETLNNTIKHSGASQLLIDLQITNAFLQLKISDNGVGLNKSAFRNDANGLRNMAARMSQIGGEYAIASHDGQTCTTIKLPV